MNTFFLPAHGPGTWQAMCTSALLVTGLTLKLSKTSLLAATGSVATMSEALTTPLEMKPRARALSHLPSSNEAHSFLELAEPHDCCCNNARNVWTQGVIKPSRRRAKALIYRLTTLLLSESLCDVMVDAKAQET